jgi:hypothetical protein
MLSGTYPESTSSNPTAAESVNFSRSLRRSGRPFRGRGNGRGFQRGNGNRNNWNANSSFDYRSNSVNHSGGRGRFSHHQRGGRSGGRHNWHRESNNYYGLQPQSFHQQRSSSFPSQNHLPQSNGQQQRPHQQWNGRRSREESEEPRKRIRMESNNAAEKSEECVLFSKDDTFVIDSGCSTQGT